MELHRCLERWVRLHALLHNRSAYDPFRSSGELSFNFCLTLSLPCILTNRGQLENKIEPARKILKEDMVMPTLEEVKTCRAYIKKVLQETTIGEGIYFKNLTFFPLINGKIDPLECLLLEEAIAMKAASVTEVSESGSVPNLMVCNNSTLPILVPEGEILIGGKQNRVVNLTVIIKPYSYFVLPVSCVEQGRWRNASASFSPEFHAPPTLRARKMRNIHQMDTHAPVEEHVQSSVWDEVDRYLDEASASAPTRSMPETFRSHQTEIDEYRKNLTLEPRANGVAAVCGGTLLGVEMFNSPAKLQRVWGRLSQAYILEALTERFQPKLPKASSQVVKDFLKGLGSKTGRKAFPAGDGFELKILKNDLFGSAVFYEGRLCHLVALTLEVQY